MCKVCRQSLGETVIDFTHCARKCSTFLLPHARASDGVLWPLHRDSNTTYTGPRTTCRGHFYYRLCCRGCFSWHKTLRPALREGCDIRHQKSPATLLPTKSSATMLYYDEAKAFICMNYVWEIERYKPEKNSRLNNNNNKKSSFIKYTFTQHNCAILTTWRKSQVVREVRVYW
ncbi:Uncharacterized protein HZ326_27914 [Fusarium oxysporum f. sp. albedinis]|nr:Uncharacterized protein HZ326_27914 [Fusarium oxysporum f. sp. albedinis]